MIEVHNNHFFVEKYMKRHPFAGYLGIFITLSGCLFLGLIANAKTASAADAIGEIQFSLIDAPPAPPADAYKPWPGRPPVDCPFPPSKTLVGVVFTGRHAEYTGADTWYPSWAADGNLYSPWTDGNVNGLNSGSGGKEATTGNAVILGNDPLKLKVVDQGIFKSDPSPYEGRYPCGSLMVDGVWYYGTYCLHPSGSLPHDGRDIQLALVGTIRRLSLVHG